MSKEVKIDMEEVFVFPHVRYIHIPIDDNSNPTYTYKKYIGNHESLTNEKVYQFHQVMFSPNKETPRRKVWVTKTDIGPYVRYEDTRDQWVDIKNQNKDE